jgi:hypothetical protein
MTRSKTSLSFIVLSVMIAVLAVTPVMFAQGETYLFLYQEFYIPASQPEVIAEGTFNLTAQSDFVAGIPSESAIGSRSSSQTYYFEMWSTDHVEIYFLDSGGGPASQYLTYVNDFVGDAPTDYTYKFFCDGYFQFNFTTSISPKLIIWSDGVDVSGNYLWLEGFSEIIYYPFYLRIDDSDATTTDIIDIDNTNSSLSAFILNDEQYDDFILDQDEFLGNTIYRNPPDSTDTVATVEQEKNFTLTFQAEKDQQYHLVMWHELNFDGISGTILYQYTYDRPFFNSYLSLFIVLIILVLFILFSVFRKYTLPPTVWFFTKLKYYLLTVPWEEFKATFGELRIELSNIASRMRGVQVEEEELICDNSMYKRWLILIQAIIGFVGLHRYMVGKYKSGIVFTLTLGFFGIGYIIDIIAVATGSFKDSEEKYILKWK